MGGLDALFQIQNPGACKAYDVVVFEGPPKTEQILWPRHCVQESWGAELHKNLKVLFEKSTKKERLMMLKNLYITK